MLNYPAVDVAIGLIFVFFILALICSGIRFENGSGCLAVDEDLGSSPNQRKRSREASDRLLRWDLESPGSC